MEKEDKELLLKDLCARLPYGVKVGTVDNDGSLENIWDVLWYNTWTQDVKVVNSCEDAEKIIDFSEIRPYLFPLSSMTEEHKKEFDQGIELELKAITNEIGPTHATAFEVDFYNKYHYDWRGLIPLGLAIDATGLNIYCL